MAQREVFARIFGTMSYDFADQQMVVDSFVLIDYTCIAISRYKNKIKSNETRIK